MARHIDTTLPRLNSEAQKLEAEARAYTKIRRQYILAQATQSGVALDILETDGIYDRANGISQGLLNVFEREADREIAEYVKKNPDKVRQSLLTDWMNESMDDTQKARREIADWHDNPKIAYFDTETTGLDAPNVPWSAAACNSDQISLLDIRMLTLDDKGNLITITPEAARVTGMSAEKIAEFLALEDNETAIIGLEGLMHGEYILTGYNTQFDRGMVCRAIQNACSRIAINDKTPSFFLTPEQGRLVKRLQELHKYFTNPAHWLETKEVFVRAIGLDPNDTPGRRTRLEDVARATRALTSEESQQHGALADCQLIARIVQNIREELETMTPKPKTAKGQIPATANPAENEPIDPNTPIDMGAEYAGDEWPKEALEHIATLEAALGQSEAERKRLFDRNTELQAALEQYANADGAHKHNEARDVTWSDIEINGFQFNFTRREGITIEQSIEAIMDHIRIMQALKSNEKVVTLRVGLKGDWKPLKGFDKPSNGKPADDEQPSANEKPATPKSQPPATASKPGTPPAANKPATPPQGNQPGNSPQGKTTGEKKSQLCYGIKRGVNEDGKTFKYSLPFLIKGEPSQYPQSVTKKRDVETLEATLRAAGYDINSFELGTEYDLPILVEWTVGAETKPGSGKFFHDNVTFTIQTDQPF